MNVACLMVHPMTYVLPKLYQALAEEGEQMSHLQEKDKILYTRAEWGRHNGRSHGIGVSRGPGDTKGREKRARGSGAARNSVQKKKKESQSGSAQVAAVVNINQRH